MIHSTTNYSYSKDELSKYGTMNDLTAMQSYNMFREGTDKDRDMMSTTKFNNNDPSHYKDIMKEQMEQAKMN